MSLTSLSMMFYTMHTIVIQACDAGFPFRYRFGGKLFDLKKLQAKAKLQKDVLDKPLYADGMTWNVKREGNARSYGLCFISI